MATLPTTFWLYCVTRSGGSGVKRVLMNGQAVCRPGRAPWRRTAHVILSGTFVKEGRLAVGCELRP
jgi:hypothetical protein